MTALQQIENAIGVNSHRINASKDDPLAMQYYQGWKSGVLAVLVVLGPRLDERTGKTRRDGGLDD